MSLTGRAVGCGVTVIWKVCGAPRHTCAGAMKRPNPTAGPPTPTTAATVLSAVFKAYTSPPRQATYTRSPSGVTLIPVGPLPTGTVATTTPVAGSTTDTLSEFSLATYTSPFRGLKTTPLGALPTATSAAVLFVVKSTTHSLPAGGGVTPSRPLNKNRPDGSISTPRMLADTGAGSSVVV